MPEEPRWLADEIRRVAGTPPEYRPRAWDFWDNRVKPLLAPGEEVRAMLTAHGVEPRAGLAELFER